MIYPIRRKTMEKKREAKPGFRPMEGVRSKQSFAGWVKRSVESHTGISADSLSENYQPENKTAQTIVDEGSRQTTTVDQVMR